MEWQTYKQFFLPLSITSLRYQTYWFQPTCKLYILYGNNTKGAKKYYMTLLCIPYQLDSANFCHSIDIKSCWNLFGAFDNFWLDSFWCSVKYEPCIMFERKGVLRYATYHRSLQIKFVSIRVINNTRLLLMSNCDKIENQKHL